MEKCVAQMKTYFPIIDSLLSYSLKEQLSSDSYAGVCLGLSTIAQSMSLVKLQFLYRRFLGLTCAFLAGLPPICGLYTAFISSLLYSLFGTSTHSYLSSNLILCFFIRNLLDRYTKPHDTVYLMGRDSSNFANLAAGNEQIAYTVTATFLASIFVALIFASRLRFLFSFISKHLLSGFSLGLTIRVFFSQINHVIHVRGHSCISELSFTVSLSTFN